MATVEKISVALPADMVAILRVAVESGEYASESEVIQEALRAWKLKRKVEALEVEELRQLVQEGIDSGPSIDADLVFSRLRTKYSALIPNQETINAMKEGEKPENLPTYKRFSDLRKVLSV